jgi:hypothetical protein
MDSKDDDNFQTKTFRDICPYCNNSYKIQLTIEKKEKGLTNTLIKPHNECGEFLIYIDNNLSIRGYQTIDSKITKNESEFNSKDFISLFEDTENTSQFYHILPIKENDKKIPPSGIITSRSVKYHNFLRSKFYHEWINHFKEENDEFRMFYIDEVFISTVNLYDELILTMGFHINDLTEEKIDIKSHIEYIKGKVVSLGEKILSL